MHYFIALYAIGLLVYPIWGLIEPASYAIELAEDYAQAATARPEQLQLAAILHWFRNTYLAFALLILVRYINQPGQGTDLRRAGRFITAYPLVDVLYMLLAQVAMSQDPQDLDISLNLRSDMLFYCVTGLALIGVSRSIPDAAEAMTADYRRNDNPKESQQTDSDSP